MKKAEHEIRSEIVARCIEMNAVGINQGTSGNISARHEGRMLVTPSATPYDEMTPESIASIALDDESGAWTGPSKPSTEWRFHQRLLRSRPDATAVIHAHPTYCTTLAIARRPIPACHYMVAAFGGDDVRCAGYATFGTTDLADLALDAMKDRTACLLANHGMIVVGDSLARAMWRAVELEALAKQYYLSLPLGPVILDAAEMAAAHEGFGGYGLRESQSSAPRAAATPVAKEAWSR